MLNKFKIQQEEKKKQKEKAGHNFDWRSCIQPYQRNSLSPEKLMAQFNPLPSPALQKKMDMYFLPYNHNQDRSKFMKFDNNKQHEQLFQLRKLYIQKGLSSQDR